MQTLRKKMFNERGGAGLSATIAIAIVGACVFVGSQLIPIYWGHWNFEDDLKTLVQFVFVNNSGKDINAVVVRETKRGLDDLGADYREKDLKITVEPKQKKVIIDVYYTRAHKVPFLTNPLPFEVHVENTTF